MAKEIERKFLVINDDFKSMAQEIHSIKQGYLSTRKEATVRVRVKDDQAYLTIKGINLGATRDEWEYPIPATEAREMLSQLPIGTLIDKTRYIVPFKGHTWEIDLFHGRHSGLILAEIELSSEDETFHLPPFIGKEVTGDPAYYNSTLASVD